MKIIVTSLIERILGLSQDPYPSAAADLIPPEGPAKDELQRRLQHAMAATCLDDMSAPFQLQLINAQERRYRLRLKFKWEWPVPVALEISVIDEETWKIDLVQDDMHP